MLGEDFATQNEKEDGDDDERANCGSRIEGLQIVQG